MNVLFISKDYAPSSDTSACIVSYLAEEFVEEGYQVDILTRDSVIEKGESKRNGVAVHRIKATLWDKMSSWGTINKESTVKKAKYFIVKYIRMIYLMCHIRAFPNSEPISTKKAIKYYKKCLSDRHYDYIITFFRPYSTMDIGRIIKSFSPDSKLISFYLDLVEDRDRPTFMPKKLYDKLIQKGDEKIFDCSEIVMLPVSAQNRKIELYDRYSQKVLYVEFPTFINHHIGDITDIQMDDDISFLYAGTLLKAYRDPTQLLSLLSDLAKETPTQQYRLDIYGGGDCYHIIDEFIKPENLNIIQHGKVPKEEIIIAMKKTRILVNITNALNSVVPSKIFEMFSSCKPILNICCNGDDGSIKYFEMYPAVFNANWQGNDIPKDLLYGFKEFVDAALANRKIEYEQIEKIYESSTPKYVVKQIINALDKE